MENTSQLDSQNVSNAGVVVYEDHQIFRLDGKNVFLEVLNAAFEIGKVQMNFCEYDPAKGNKQTKNIPIYMNIDKFLVFANDVLTGRINKLGEGAKKTKAKLEEEAKAKGDAKTIYAKPIFDDMGGVTMERFKKQSKKYNFDVPEGHCISRIFYVTPGEKMPWMLSGQIGLGKENSNKLIVPQGFPKEIVRIPCDNEALKALVLVTKAHIEAYYTSLYLKKKGA